jgi:hypothetical protein
MSHFLSFLHTSLGKNEEAGGSASFIQSCQTPKSPQVLTKQTSEPHPDLLRRILKRYPWESTKHVSQDWFGKTLIQPHELLTC